MSATLVPTENAGMNQGVHIFTGYEVASRRPSSALSRRMRSLDLDTKMIHDMQMNVAALKSEIENFLGSNTAEVLVICGKWGVGKTFAWNKFLREARERPDGIALDSYAYVSLFGLRDLNEVRQAIFENTVKKERAGDSADFRSLVSVIKNAKDGWRKVIASFRDFWYLRNFSTSIERFSFFTVTNQIVCIDDIERKSKSLEIRDILGLVSFLKDQRKCKVVVILNDEKLSEDDADFRVQLEKIADSIINYNPSPRDAVIIGADNSGLHHDVIYDACLAFGIVNIRTIKKLERISYRISKILEGYDDRVKRQAIHSACLFVYSISQPEQAPSIEYLKSYNPYKDHNADNSENLNNSKWRNMLHDYGFQYLDELDNVLIEEIINGYIDPERLKSAANMSTEKYRNIDAEHKFDDAWNLYHGSFDDNTAAVIDALIMSLNSSISSVISPTNLSSTIGLLRDLDWKGDVNKLITGYIENSDKGRDFWDLSESAFGDSVRDEGVREAFVAKLATFDSDRNPADILKRLGQTHAWHGDDIRFLAYQSQETYYGIFKRLSGKDLRHALRGALLFRSVEPSSPEMIIVGERAEAALQQIAQESAINLRRVRQLGVEIHVTNPALDNE